MTINNQIKLPIVREPSNKQETDELKQIQEEIFENFQERIQLRRALMEIEE